MGHIIPDAKNCDGLFTKKKGFRVLDLKVMMLPLAMNTVVLEHVGLPLFIQQQNYSKQIDTIKTISSNHTLYKSRSSE